jgi:hypothetical protein
MVLKRSTGSHKPNAMERRLITCVVVAFAAICSAGTATPAEADNDPGPAISAQAVMYGNHRILPGETEVTLARQVEMQNLQIQQLSKQLKEMPRMIESKVGCCRMPRQLYHLDMCVSSVKNCSCTRASKRTEQLA